MESTGNSMLVVGASCRAAAQRIAQCGWVPLAADQFLDRDLLSVAESLPLEQWEEAVRRWLPQHPGLLLLPAGGLENAPEMVDRLRELGVIAGVNGESLPSLRDPHRWKNWAERSGLLWPSTISEPHPLSTMASATSPAATLWLLKQRSLAAGLGVSHWASGPWDPDDAYLQVALQGMVLGATFVSDAAATYCLGGAAAWTPEDFPAPLPYLYRGNLAPQPWAEGEQEVLQVFGERVRGETGIRGVWQADLMRTSDGLALLEINPRWSASMELLDTLYGPNLIDWHATALRGGSLSRTELLGWTDASRGKVEPMLGKCVVYSPVTFVPSKDLLERWWNRRWNADGKQLDDEGVRFADIPSEPIAIEAGVPILTCLVRGPDRATVLKHLQAAHRGVCENARRSLAASDP